MMKRFPILILLIICPYLHAQVTIRSSLAWSQSFSTGSWTNNEGLTYSSTAWGDTYYNPKWQDMSKQTSIQSSSIWRYYNVGPSNKRNWTFTLPINNLNAEKNHYYYTNANPSLKQQSHQIYWGISIGMMIDGVEKNVYFWMSRSARDYYYDGTPTYTSENYLSCSVEKGGWTTTSHVYPSCSQSATTSLYIESSTYGQTTIKWDGFQITSVPYYVSKITYVKVMVGTQAKIQLGKASAYSGAPIGSTYDGSDLMEKEQYSAAISKLYQSSGVYLEKPALNLAFCYLITGQPDKCIEMASALVKYNGETISYAYYLRGMARENKSNYLDALEDYRLAGSVATDEYNRLYNTIYSSNKSVQTNNSQQKKQQSTQQNTKPALTR